MARLPKSIIKKYGITKKAWAVFRGQKTVKKYMVKRRGGKRKSYRARVSGAAHRYTRRGRGLLGGLGAGLTLKSVAFGTAGLLVAERFQPFGGAYKPAIDKIAIGLVGPMVGMDNHDMLTVGVKEGLATFVDGFLGGSSSITGGDTL